MNLFSEFTLAQSRNLLSQVADIRQLPERFLIPANCSLTYKIFSAS
jgi:hypothetical protein